MKKVLSVVLALAMVLGMSTSVFATSTEKASQGMSLEEAEESYKIDSMELLKEKLNEVEIDSTISVSEKEAILQEIKPSILNEFIEDKLEIFGKKLKKLEMSANDEERIDLGDGCSVVVKTFDVPDELVPGIQPLANTPGADTYWKDYGNRRFTTRFEFTTGLINWVYILVHQYTLSSSGVDYRGSYADIESGMVVNIGTASYGSIRKHQKVAHSKGESTHISCKFTCRWAPKADVSLVEETLDIHSYVKFSDIDKVGKQVKVVQSWNGTWS